MDLREVQSIQATYDKEHWAHAEGKDTIDHCERHISKLAGKLATIAEQHDHGVKVDLSVLENEIIPDLLIFAARLANNQGLDLNNSFPLRTALLEEHFRNKNY